MIALTNIVCGVKGVGRKLIPKTAYAIVGGRTVVEIRMGEVETNIHHAYHHTHACVGLWKRKTLIGFGGTEVSSRNIHQSMCATLRFDTANLAILR